MGFREKVIAATRQIPAGQTRSYKEVAATAGSSGAWRAVGNILNRVWRTDRGQTIPCHRVIKSDGQPGGYAGGINKKISRLRLEGKLP